MKNHNVKNQEVVIVGEVIPGHQVASGKSPDTPYPTGTIEMQLPFFQERGADFGEIYPATLNFSILPHRFKIIKPDYFFERVEWTDRHPPENFSFVRCRIDFTGKWQDAFIYYPHPETKQTHFSKDTILEILTGYVPGVKYGMKGRISLSIKKIHLFNR